jgi:hypothetical protein
MGMQEAVARAAAWRLAGQSVQVICGFFDPLLASHARAIERQRIAGGRVITVLVEPAEAILPARARGEMTAALQDVDAVVLPGEAMAFDAWIDLRAEDGQRRDEFVAHVRRRNAG